MSSAEELALTYYSAAALNVSSKHWEGNFESDQIIHVLKYIGGGGL
jgi:hypothetical protein